MSRESAHGKARRYLAEGRLTVRQLDWHGAVAIVRGDSGLLYRAAWSADFGWLCNCPTRTDQCAHLTALRLITVVEEVMQ